MTELIPAMSARATMEAIARPRYIAPITLGLSPAAGSGMRTKGSATSVPAMAADPIRSGYRKITSLPGKRMWASSMAAATVTP